MDDDALTGELAKIEELASVFADGRQDRTDGLTVEFEDWWFNVRPSNTEPLLRLNVEARPIPVPEGGKALWLSAFVEGEEIEVVDGPAPGSLALAPKPPIVLPEPRQNAGRGNAGGAAQPGGGGRRPTPMISRGGGYDAASPYVLAWYDADHRAFPWRETRDPYAVLVSEVMLQQTQATRVVERFPRFLARFPTARRLAAADPAAVLAEWNGLGYNRRALALRATATAVDRDGWPADVHAFQRLPGVGPYTARAIA